jgi:hypothetical protein
MNEQNKEELKIEVAHLEEKFSKKFSIEFLSKLDSEILEVLEDFFYKFYTRVRKVRTYKEMLEADTEASKDYMNVEEVSK